MASVLPTAISFTLCIQTDLHSTKFSGRKVYYRRDDECVSFSLKQEYKNDKTGVTRYDENSRTSFINVER